MPDGGTSEEQVTLLEVFSERGEGGWGSLQGTHGTLIRQVFERRGEQGLIS